MGIRLSGLVSNLDTDTIVQELVSAYSIKKVKLEKEQTKLSWKQEKWKDLNSKIYKLYKKLGDMRLSQIYNQKATTVSNEARVSVTSDAKSPIGTQSLEITRLAKTAYLTGGVLKTQTGDKVNKDTKLSDLNPTFNTAATINVVAGDGTEKKIEINGDTTIKGFTESLASAGLVANFDEKNQRIFVSAKESGGEKNFNLTTDSVAGVDALKSLGLFINSADDKKLYQEWAQYSDAVSGGTLDPSLLSDPAKAQALNDLIAKTLQDRKDGLTAQNANYQQQIDDLNKANQDIVDSMNNLFNGNQTLRNKTDAAGQVKLTDFVDRNKAIKQLQDKIPDLQKKIDEATTPADKTAAEQVLQAHYDDITAKSQSLAQDVDTAALNGLTKDEIVTYINNASQIDDYSDQQNENSTTIGSLQNQITTNQELIDNTSGSNTLENGIKQNLASRISESKKIVDDYNTNAYKSVGDKIDGEDAIIKLNGADFTSSSNTFVVNGLTIQAKEAAPGETISVVTATDTKGIYDTIKGVIKDYNAIINEIDTLFNAKSAKGYEPLTDEEKDAMTETEVEKWEQKIKDSLFRRDDTLGGIGNSLKSAMQASFTINGKRYSLASFGIKTQSYFASSDNEKSAFHIDGDSDYESVATKSNELLSALNEDPDTVIDFFKQLTGKVYKELDNRMKTTTLKSVYTVYNDKKLQSDYDDYTKKIKAQEEKITAMEEKYYKQFTAMEKALSQLQSSQNALSGLFGG